MGELKSELFGCPYCERKFNLWKKKDLDIELMLASAHLKIVEADERALEWEKIAREYHIELIKLTKELESHEAD